MFRFQPQKVRNALFWEWLHGMLLAIPSGILLLVIWELFEPAPDTDKVWVVVGIMTLLFLFQLFVGSKAMIQSSIMTYEIGRKLRLGLGDKLQRLSLGYYKSRDPGDLAAVVLQDVATFEGIFGHSIPNLANAIFGVMVLSGFLLYLDWRLGITLLLALILVIPLMQWSSRLIGHMGKKQVQARTDTSARLLEYVQGIQHLKAYGLKGEKFTSLKNAMRSLRDESIRVEAVPGPVVLAVGVVLELCFVLMVWLALYLLGQGTVTIPVIIAFLIIGYRLYEPIKVLMVEYPVLTYLNVSLNRIQEVFEAEEQSAGQQRQPQYYDIQFDKVSFGYVDEKPVLKDVSFLASSGTLTALVGPSGSGKTTITALIARFWDAQKGTISIGGIPLSDIHPQQVYSLISEVFQEVYLFDGSIYENIQIGNPQASEIQVQEAARLAQVYEFADLLPKGLDTLVGEGGSKLSGGQKQRISIARALLKDAPIVLLDEATASLDPENEIYIQQAIQALVKEKTVIVIAHKLATIQQADQILVLNDGQIVESGTHDALLADAQGLYTHLWHTQQKTRGWKIISEARERKLFS
ncbi:MAG: ABC transporter ATP-binding protein [Bacteroidota bacterium]